MNKCRNSGREVPQLGMGAWRLQPRPLKEETGRRQRDSRVISYRSREREKGER